MNRRLASSAVLLVLFGSSLAAAQQSPTRAQTVMDWTSHRVTYRVVQQTPQYELRQPEVISGARVTLFANFLGNRPGIVMFNLDGTSMQCQVIEWKGQSVTAKLPHLGLLEPKHAEIQIVLPDGRIAKTFRVLLVMPADIVIHAESVPVPVPPAPANQSPVYATP